MQILQNTRDAVKQCIAAVFTDWRMVFRGVKGAGTDMYAAFIDGTHAVTDDVTCMTLEETSCSHHFRSTVLDNWSSLSYTRVTTFYRI